MSQMKSYEEHRTELLSDIESLDKSYAKTLKRSQRLREVLDKKPPIRLINTGDRVVGYRVCAQGKSTSFMLVVQGHKKDDNYANNLIQITVPQLKEIEESLKDPHDLPKLLVGKELGGWETQGLMRGIWTWLLENPQG